MDRASEVFSFCGKLDINVQKKTYNLEQLLAQLILDIAYATQPYVLHALPTELFCTPSILLSLLECITDHAGNLPPASYASLMMKCSIYLSPSFP